MLHFCEIVRLSSFTVGNPAHSLQQLSNRVKHNIMLLEKQFPELADEYKNLYEEFARLGISPDDTFLYSRASHYEWRDNAYSATRMPSFTLQTRRGDTTIRLSPAAVQQRTGIVPPQPIRRCNNVNQKHRLQKRPPLQAAKSRY